MRQELTASQKGVLGEVVELSPHANQEPVQVHVHVGDGGTAATRGRFPLLGIIGMATIGIVAYSLYQGQPVSITVGQHRWFRTSGNGGPCRWPLKKRLKNPLFLKV